MAKATYGTEPAPIPCSAFNQDGTIYAYALSYDWSKGFAVCWVQALPVDAACCPAYTVLKLTTATAGHKTHLLCNVQGT